MQIESKQQLKTILNEERKLYLSDNKRKRLVQVFRKHVSYEIWKFQRALRMSEYWMNKPGHLASFRFRMYERYKNKLGNKLGLEIESGCFEKGLKIYHTGIVVNRKARIGENCRLHGSNCIGNNGVSDDAPIIANNVDIGYGALIIGAVEIADNVTVGAGSVVTKSFEKNSVVVGVPAKRIR